MQHLPPQPPTPPPTHSENTLTWSLILYTQVIWSMPRSRDENMKRNHSFFTIWLICPCHTTGTPPLQSKICTKSVDFSLTIITINSFGRMLAQRNNVKAYTKVAGHNIYRKLYLWHHIKTVILQIAKMEQ